MRSTFWPASDLDELESGIARFGFDAHPDFGELARAARLFLVTILGLAVGL